MKAALFAVTFLAVFLGICGVALWLTPKIAAWIDEKRGVSPDPMGEEKAQEENKGE